MSVYDLSLYLVLDPDLCGGPAQMVATAEVAARHGATVVQLRAPDWKKRQWLETAFELKAILDSLGVPLIINDHIDIALAVDAAGVHVGQADMPANVVRRLIGPDKLLGLSITAAAELARSTVDRGRLPRRRTGLSHRHQARCHTGDGGGIVRRDHARVDLAGRRHWWHHGRQLCGAVRRRGAGRRGRLRDMREAPRGRCDAGGCARDRRQQVSCGRRDGTKWHKGVTNRYLVRCNR